MKTENITPEEHLTALTSAARIVISLYPYLHSTDYRELINAAWVDMTERNVLNSLSNYEDCTPTLLIAVCKRSMQTYIRGKYDTRHNRCPSLAFLSTSLHDEDGELIWDVPYIDNIGQELEDSDHIWYVINNCGLKEREFLTVLCMLQRCTITEICDRLGISRTGYFDRQRKIVRKIKWYVSKQNRETL